MRVRHEFVVRREGLPVPGPEFPRLSTTADLGGRHASAFFDLMFPYGGVEPALLDDYRAVCEVTGLRLPPNSFRLNTSTKKGDRKLVKLPDFL